MSTKVKVFPQPDPNMPRDKEYLYMNKHSFDSLPIASCSEIELNDIGEFFGPNELISAYQKLRHKGILRVLGVDAFNCIHMFNNGIKTLEELAEHIMHGRTFLNSIPILRDHLKANTDCEIRLCTTYGDRYVLEVYRP